MMMLTLCYPFRILQAHWPRRIFRVVIGLALGVALPLNLAGCARYPSSATGTTPALLFVTLQVQGQINPSYYYFVALQASPDNSVQSAHPELGPFAVVQANTGTSGWGNGWGTGQITDYIQYNTGQAAQYSIDTSNAAQIPAKVAAGGLFVGPAFSTSISPDGHSLTVAVQVSTLGLNAMPASTRTTPPGGIVVNVITTDHLEHNPTAPPKPVDSLDQGSLPLLDLHQSKVVDITPAGSVLFPNNTVNTADLQLTHVELEVRLP